MLVETFLRATEPLVWDSATAAARAVLGSDCRGRGVALGNLDMMIAAHAVAVDATLGTSDQAFRKIGQGLNVVHWHAQSSH